MGYRCIYGGECDGCEQCTLIDDPTDFEQQEQAEWDKLEDEDNNPRREPENWVDEAIVEQKIEEIIENE